MICTIRSKVKNPVHNLSLPGLSKMGLPSKWFMNLLVLVLALKSTRSNLGKGETPVSTNFQLMVP